MKCQHFLVSGQVQGVSYRAFVKRQAEALGLTGKVRNLSDGRVEILVLGAVETLSKLRQMLLQGPRMAKVDSLAMKDIADRRHFEGFLIEEDGQTPWFDSVQS